MTTTASTLSQVLAHFEPLKRRGSGFRTRCPAHGGQSDDSLSITEKDGVVLLKCWSHQCPPKDIVVAAGLTMADLFPERPSPVANDPIIEKREHVARDFEGLVLARHYIHKRSSGKKQPVWWDPTGLSPNSTFPLYGSERLKDWDQGREIILVEGEKTADNLLQRGYHALAAYGSPHRPPRAMLQPLVGFPLYLWPDADPPGEDLARGLTTPPPGRVLMDYMGNVLSELGETPFLISWAGAPPHGDAANYMGDVDALLSDAMPWEPLQFVPELLGEIKKGDPIAEPEGAQGVPPRRGRVRFWGPRSRL